MAQQVFVAREQELAQLNGFLDKALAGQGQASSRGSARGVCFVTGEAGAGKTALVTEFARRAQAQHADLLVAIGECNAQTGIGDPYLPFREVLGLLTGDVEARLARGTITQENASRLRAFLRISGQALIDLGPDLIDILVPGVGVATRAGAFLAGRVGWLDRLEELTERKAATASSPGADQTRIFEQYTQVIQGMAAQQPLILVLDDLHWADASSISLLFHLARRLGESRILMVGTYRLEDVALGRRGERHPLESVVNEVKRYHGDVSVDLGQTAETEGRGFVDALLDRESNRLGEDFRKALFQHTGGHPLFAIELIRDMRERGDLLQDEVGHWVEGPRLDWSTLPARVEGVIEERIARLEEELRETLAVASVEGEEFTAQVLAQVRDVNERQLARRLRRELDRQHRLVREQGILRVDGQRLGRYRFRHALFQKYLYDSLGEMERMYLHEDVGNVLETLYGDQAGEIAVQLARHFQEAEIAEKAIDYLLEAGKRAVRLSAYEEAIVHLTRGLELLKTLPETPERDKRELELQIALGVPLMATKGPGAPEVESVYARARVLCQQVAETPQLFPVLFGLWRFYLLRAKLHTARELAEQLLSLAQSQDDLAFLLEAHFALGGTLFWIGEVVPAREHLEQVIALYDPQQHSSHAFLFGQDPLFVCLAYAAFALWVLGYPDQAQKSIQKAFALAQERDHPFSLAYTLYGAAMVYQFRREVEVAQERTEAGITHSTDQGFPYFLAMHTILRGWALAEQREGEEGITQMSKGLSAWRATGSEVHGTYFLALLAEAYGKAGQAEKGLGVLDDALVMAEKNGEHWYQAELHRLKGELLRMQGQDESAIEACFRQAVQVARKQSAKSLELRAVVSLSRLWQQQGKPEEARKLLAETYGWFTEGFDTADLQEARALLTALS